MRPLNIFMLGLLCATSVPAVALAHGGHGSALPIEACQSSTLGDNCAYENDHHDVYRGTCRLMSGSLRCVRTQPVERPASETAPLQERESSSAPMTAGLFGLVAAIAWASRRRRRR